MKYLLWCTPLSWTWWQINPSHSGSSRTKRKCDRV